MTLDETLDLLGQIALIDDRVVRTEETEQAAQLILWARTLRAVPYQFALEAVADHYAESAWAVMPKDITARWRKVTKARVESHTWTLEPNRHPDVDPDDRYGAASVAALRRQLDDVRQGDGEPMGLRELLSGNAAVGSGPNDTYRQARETMRRLREERRWAEEQAS